MHGGCYSYERGPRREGLTMQEYAVKVKLTATVHVRAPDEIVARTALMNKVGRDLRLVLARTDIK
jgi:hypothetical protein